MSSGRRWLVFALLLVVCAGVAGVAMLSAVRAGDHAAASTPGARGALAGAHAERRPVVVFRNLRGERAATGQVAVAEPGGPRRPPDPRAAALRSRLLRGRQRPLPRPRPGLRRGLRGADLRARPARAPHGVRRRDAEPRARLARRPLRLGHPVRHRPLLRRRGRLLDADDADRHAARPAHRRARGLRGHPRRAPRDRRGRRTSGASPSRATPTASTRPWPPGARPT